MTKKLAENFKKSEAAQAVTVDLGAVERPAGTSLYSGFEFGLAARRQLGLTALDIAGTPVNVRLPDDAPALTLSFFRGLFSGSLRRFGPEKFENQYSFEGPEHLTGKIDGDYIRGIHKTAVAMDRLDPRRPIYG